jgi:tetratricopeptide (TPR) repeat protein
MEPEPTLIVPGSPEALPKLLELGLPVDRLRPTVLWLDDLERYLQGSGVSRTVFEDLGKQESRVVVLATITLTANDQLHSGKGEIGYSVREILDLFEEVNLPDDNSPSEREEARRLYPSQHFAAGIGEHFAAARELLGKFKRSLEGNPHGFAVVVAALDWRRAGMSRAITEEELRELYALCLEDFHPLLEPGDESYKDGLVWARTPLQSRAALLMPVPAAKNGVGGFQIFDFVRDWADGTGSDVDPRLQRVLDSSWPFVIRRAEPAEAFAIGHTAYARGELHPAENAWRKVGDSGDPDLAPRAAFNLGLLLKEQRRPPEAVGALKQAADSGHRDIAPMAARNLGLLLYLVYRQDRAQEAVVAFQQAIDSRHPNYAPEAAIALGRLLEEQGRSREAEEAYKWAVHSGASEEVVQEAKQALQRLRTHRDG